MEKMYQSIKFTKDVKATKLLGYGKDEDIIIPKGHEMVLFATQYDIYITLYSPTDINKEQPLRIDTSDMQYSVTL
ncbi:hypothetical protein [Virgibacillus proomii]|uniref:hypothetical protein n=1 Tax=Virgibacillus proomii TaxID=84407 RepID=UPI001C10579A|nr:hypothetical protein [Virgibacillus proomii]MBU5266277.1 hypothetical protein [Virgibacillus proomii]